MKSKITFKRSIFPNGLTLVTERNPAFRSLSIGIWVKLGTRHESPKDAGVSHFLEHMLFKGTSTRSALEIAMEVDQVGGEFNAFTAREYTCFHVLVLDRDLDLGIDILMDILLHSEFDPEELERERKVILQEISMVEENPEELAHDIFSEVAFGRHGLGRPILGSVSSIRRMRRGDLLRYFRKHYRPDQLIVSVAGDVSHQAVKKKLRSHARGQWKDRPKKGELKKARDPAGVPRMKEGRWWVVRPTEQVHIVWAVSAPSYTSRDRFAALLLNVYLGGGMSSQLFQEIREKNGLAYTVFSSLSPFVDTGVFSVYAATQPSQVPLCLKLLEECVMRPCRELLTDEQLELVKNNLKGTILLSADNVESRMHGIAKGEMFFGEYKSAEEICEMVDRVTPADVRRVARKMLSHGRTSMLALGPRPKPSMRKRIKAKILKR